MMDELKQRRLLLLSVLHNIGRMWRDKQENPFMSLTTGKNAFNVAYSFVSLKKENNNSFFRGVANTGTLCKIAPKRSHGIAVGLLLEEVIEWFFK